MTTPHGDADIRVTNQRATTTLAELIVAATGQAAPAVARVDGRTIDASTTLDHTGLRRGSVIDTVATAVDTEPPALAILAQIAGPGAGRRRTLVSGRHRLGPGRRVNATELSSAPVEEPVATIDVDSDGSVTLHPIAGHPVTLGGSPVDAPTPWFDGRVAVMDDRAFVIDRDIAASPTDDRRVEVAADHARADPGSEGWIAFHRRPRSAGATVRRPAIDAVLDATTRGPGLWQRRPADADAFVVPIGMRASGQPPDAVSIDLATNRIVSIAGPRRAGAARALLLEATTLHGPADLEVVVATAGLDDWDWVKWLPHVRAAGRSAILRDATEFAAWCDAVIEHEPPQLTMPHLTLLVVDDPGLWKGRESPLHRLLTTPPDHIRFVALSPSPADAPHAATILFADDAQRRWRLISTTGADGVEDVLAALVETDVARRVAVSMAALDDQEAPVRLPTSHADPRPLRSVVSPTGSTAADGILDEVCDGGAVIVGTDHETARTAAVLALRRCLAQPCLLLDLLGSPWTAGLDGLAGRRDDQGDSSTVDPDRLSARLRHHLADGSTAVVVLVDADHEAGARVVETAAGLDGITVLATTSSEPAGAALPIVHTERRDGRRRATIDVGGVEHTVALDDDPDTGELSVRALVCDRPLTALERRIEREATRHPEAFVAACHDLVAEFAPRTRLRPPVLARPPLPAPLHVRSLFARYPGDGIPIGLVDDPADDHDALWWRPDDGHLVAVGPGLDGLLDTVMTGLVDRYGDDEVEIIDGSAITADDGDGDIENDVRGDDTITALLERLDPTARTDREHGTLLVVVIGDLGALRRRERMSAGRLDTAFASGRFVVVGRAPTLEDAGVIAADATTMLLVASPGDARGRCRLAPDGRLVQLAETDRPSTATGSMP